MSALPEGVAAGDYTTVRGGQARARGHRVDRRRVGRTRCDGAGAQLRGLTVGAVAGARTPAVVGTCRMPTAREYPDAATLFAALRSGQVERGVDVDRGAGHSRRLVVLSDRTSLIRAENVVPLYRRNELTERQVLALNEMAGVLDTGALADMRARSPTAPIPVLVADASGWPPTRSGQLGARRRTLAVCVSAPAASASTSPSRTAAGIPTRSRGR